MIVDYRWEYSLCVPTLCIVGMLRLNVISLHLNRFALVSRTVFVKDIRHRDVMSINARTIYTYLPPVWA